MMHNDNEQPYGRWSAPAPRPWTPVPQRAPVAETVLHSNQVTIERKTFQLALKENVRGRLLRITEDNNGRYNSIILPATGLKDLQKILAEMIQTSESLPEPKTPAA